MLLAALLAHCFPEFNRWLAALPDPRQPERCIYTACHIWWAILLTFLLRGGSRNAMDGDRNSGLLPDNVLKLCNQIWDPERLGDRKTVTCSGNAVYHASRVAVSAVAQIPILMIRRLMEMRLLDFARLFDTYWMVVVDGTLQDRGHDTPQQEARYRYVVEAKLLGLDGLVLHLASEFMDMRDPVTQKEDCELRAFERLARRIKAAFPKLSLCLLFDGLYPVEPMFDICQTNGWKFIATLKEGRQPLAWEEAVATMMMSPEFRRSCTRKGENGPVQQTLRWTEKVPFGARTFSVVFAGEISPAAPTLWCWVTNLMLTPDRVEAIANQGGRARNRIEDTFNVEKNGGFGLEHAFCANDNASQNYHIMLQVAYTLWQLLAQGVLRRLVKACRKVTDRKLTELLRTNLLLVPIAEQTASLGQIRFSSA